MTERLKKIFDELPSCDTFADIGCDHGYIAEAMLKSGKCKRVIISDISQKCLDKAINLLSEKYSGRFKAVVSNGFAKVGGAQVALIAGMGGEVICDIISSAAELPQTLVLQPMKNADKVRLTLLNGGYKILKDYTFKDGKFYDLIVAEKGEDGGYTADELTFGRDNLKLKNADFKEYLLRKRAELVIAREKAVNVTEIDERIKKYTEISDEL